MTLGGSKMLKEMAVYFKINSVIIYLYHGIGIYIQRSIIMCFKGIEYVQWHGSQLENITISMSTVPLSHMLFYAPLN